MSNRANFKAQLKKNVTESKNENTGGNDMNKTKKKDKTSSPKIIFDKEVMRQPAKKLKEKVCDWLVDYDRKNNDSLKLKNVTHKTLNILTSSGEGIDPDNNDRDSEHADKDGVEKRKESTNLALPKSTKNFVASVHLTDSGIFSQENSSKFSKNGLKLFSDGSENSNILDSGINISTSIPPSTGTGLPKSSVKRKLFVNEQDLTSTPQLSSSSRTLAEPLSDLSNDLMKENSEGTGAVLFNFSLPIGSSALDLCSIDELNSFPLDFMDEDLVCANEGDVRPCPEENSFDPPNTSTANKKKQSRRYTPPEKLTRKRLSNPSKWKRNENKLKIARGEEYTTHKGKVIKAHALQPACDESCRMGCSTKEELNEDKRQELFNHFWKKLPSKQTKWLYLQGLVPQSEKKNLDVKNRRKHSRKYFLPVNGTLVRVCKVMFLATFDISDGQVSTAHKKISSSPNDKRGKNAHRPMPINQDLKNSVREHIKSLPKMPPHYTRADSQKEYLVGNIESVAQLHEMYLDWLPQNAPSAPIASYRQYNDIFNEEFNLEFFVSKKDTCDLCTEFQNASEERKLQLQETFDDHDKNKDLAQTMRLADQEVAKKPISKNLAVVCFDYEKTLICPKAPESVFYYRRKLSVNNFTVVRVGKINEERCYVYDETIARKGSNEVASLLFHFIQDKIAEGVTEFRLYCDNCWGQNKNRGVAALLALVVGCFKDKHIKIVLRFLEKGHSYNAADTTHSVIEKKTRKAKIYTPEEWYAKIEQAKRVKTNPIKVIKVKQEMIFDFMELAGKLNFATDQHGATVPFTKIREIVCDSENPYKLQIKLSLDSNSPQTVSLKKIGKPVNFETYPLKSVYQTGPLPITKKKMDDLMYYCNRNLIPVEHHDYYRGLMAVDAGDNENDDETILMPQPGRAKKRRARQTQKGKKKAKEASDSEEDPDDPFQ